MDEDIDRLLGPLRQIEPDAATVASWKRSQRRHAGWGGLAAALLIGFAAGLLAATYVGQPSQQTDWVVAQTKVERFVNMDIE